jgi:hypothetical protein
MSVTTGSMADQLGMVIHGFDDAVIDSEIEVGEDSRIMFQ